MQKLIKSGSLSFKDINPNIQSNLLPKPEVASINMVYECPDEYRVCDVNFLRVDLVQMYATLCGMGNLEQHDYKSCRVCY